MRLYNLERVIAVEASEQWETLKQRADRRRASADKAVETKRQQLMSELNILTGKIAQLPLELLYQQICNAYNSRQIERRTGSFKLASANFTPAVLKRIAVTNLRYALTQYAYKLICLHGRVGVRDAYREINRKVYAAIAETYPALQKECDRQLARKFRPVENRRATSKAGCRPWSAA